MIWQAMIFMETDLYHVLAAALRCPDLHAMSRMYLRHRARRLRRRPGLAAEAGWTDRDRVIVRRYALVVLLGGAAMIGLAAVTAIPALSGFAMRIYQGLAAGSFRGPRFWDSLVVSAAFVAQFGVLGGLLARSRRQRRASEARAASAAAQPATVPASTAPSATPRAENTAPDGA
jgi:hypothetical protein